MADVISLKPQSEEPAGLVCLNCFSTTFYIFPDAIVTCSTCNHIMELGVPYGTLFLRSLTKDD